MGRFGDTAAVARGLKIIFWAFTGVVFAAGFIAGAVLVALI